MCINEVSIEERAAQNKRAANDVTKGGQKVTNDVKISPQSLDCQKRKIVHKVIYYYFAYYPNHIEERISGTTKILNYLFI